MNKGSKLIITLCVMLGTQSFPVVKGMNIAKDMSNINGAPHLKALEGSSMNSLSHSVSGKVTNYPKNGNKFDLQLHNVNHHPDFSKEKPNNKWPQQEKEHTELQSIDLAVKLIKERESVSGTSENEILLNVDALLGGIYRVFKSRSNSFSAFEDIEFISGYILESLSLHLREEVLLKYKARRTELINNISDLHRTADKINGAKYLVDYLLKTKNFLKLLASELHCITMNPVSKINFVESYRYGMKSSATGHLQLLLTGMS
ncbi:hypothetical protein BY996DRAFT_6415139 [Phakopsora pachyrhizi]|nr:hypothetical protein BY996DRAFT_6415139 [Phakopsora pachyrhizi]